MVQVIEPGVEPTAIDGLVVLTMKQVTDERGTVRELYRESNHVGLVGGPLGPWRQVNATSTRQGGLRGLHAEDMTKLVAVVSGEALGAYVDLRAGSATFGAVSTVRLVPGVQVLVPRGVANGFQATSPGITEYLYCFDKEWAPGMAGQAVNPLDPALGIDWPIPVDSTDRSQISQKDLEAPRLAELRRAT
jgi:dTDP-4-dehydrorhamnose 3,5-epimerase